jgi:hypothetical protein
MIVLPSVDFGTISSFARSVISKIGLSLWLKADAGVSFYKRTYASEIILTGAYTTEFNGTYIATSTPDEEGNYTLQGPNYTIRYDGPNNQYIVSVYPNYDAGSFVSSDGVNWSILNSILNPPPYVSGITGDYSDGNGQYSYAEDDPRNNNYTKGGNDGYYFIDGGAGNWTLRYYIFGDVIVLATNSNTTPSGSWTNVNATGSITSTSTLFPQGSSPTGSVTISEYGDNIVSEWADQSTNGRNAYQNNNVASPVIIGGKSFINFPAYTNLVCSQIWYERQFIGTIFCVARFTENTPVNSFLVNHEDNFIFFRNSSNTFSLTFDDQTYLTSSNILNANTNYILETTFNADTASLYYNGILVGTASLGSVNGGYNLFIGGGAGSSNIAETIVYNRVITTEERQQVEAYLNQKYQIY